MIKTPFIENLDNFSDIYEINLNAQPNSEFTTTINNQIYRFDIKTLIDNKTQISIFKDDEFIGGGFVKVGLNYCFMSEKENGAFFFLKNTNSNLIDFNFSNFGNELKLYYAVFDKNIDSNSELANKYILLKNVGDIAVWG